MDKESKIDLPKIPGRVFSARNQDKHGFLLILAILVCLFAGGVFSFADTEEIIFLLIIAGFGVLSEYSKMKCPMRVNYTDVTENKFSVQFGDDDVVEDDLENYALYIIQMTREGSRASTKHYSYGASLVQKSRVNSDGSVEPPKYNQHYNITLVAHIMCPVKLKEWVESFQSQIAKPLPIAFSSPEIESDYSTGIYRSVEKLKQRK